MEESGAKIPKFIHSIRINFTFIAFLNTQILATIGFIALVANLKFFPMAVESLGFHNMVYLNAIIAALLAAWGFLTMRNTDELSLVEIQDIQKKTEASGIKKCDPPVEEVRRVSNCYSLGPKYSVANAALRERNCCVNPNEMSEWDYVTNVPRRKKSSRVLQLQVL